ncbi:hypothetical protein C8N46_1065 [Kordia periserrulae]|uniref:Uncharacterized protein n=1 Tax=Kordia periserrulae TaxID=701523 RepID=A0A2T6BWB4_9FLAO|nr:hypothetical protein C8N46_1065 [Kordia periserrulae]
MENSQVINAWEFFYVNVISIAQIICEIFKIN